MANYTAGVVVVAVDFSDESGKTWGALAIEIRQNGLAACLLVFQEFQKCIC